MKKILLLFFVFVFSWMLVSCSDKEEMWIENVIQSDSSSVNMSDFFE